MTRTRSGLLLLVAIQDDDRLKLSGIPLFTSRPDVVWTLYFTEIREREIVLDDERPSVGLILAGDGSGAVLVTSRRTGQHFHWVPLAQVRYQLVIPVRKTRTTKWSIPTISG